MAQAKFLLIIIGIIGMPTVGSEQHYSYAPTAATPIGEMSATATSSTASLRSAQFGLGCFWGSEATFGAQPGVVATQVGYAGGTTKDPTYRSMGDHTETVLVKYDSKLISYARLVAIFFKAHDATLKHKTQYKSVVFFADDAERAAAAAELAERQRHSKIVTELQPTKRFYAAEGYHQKYFLKQHSALFRSLSKRYSLDQLVDSTLAARLNAYVHGVGMRERFEQERETWALSDDEAAMVRRCLVDDPIGHCTI